MSSKIAISKSIWPTLAAGPSARGVCGVSSGGAMAWGADGVACHCGVCRHAEISWTGEHGSLRESKACVWGRHSTGTSAFLKPHNKMHPKRNDPVENHFRKLTLRTERKLR